LSLTGKYQLVVLGQNGNAAVNSCASQLINVVGQAFDGLGVNPKKFLASSTPASPSLNIDRRMLVVAVYLGLTTAPVLSAAEMAVLK
jgi:hypothetical protein